MVDRQMADGLLQVCQSLGEFVDRGHAAFASGLAGFGFAACLRFGFASTAVVSGGAVASPCSSLVVGVISSGVTPSASVAGGVGAGASSFLGSFRRLVAIAAYSELISQAMKCRLAHW